MQKHLLNYEQWLVEKIQYDTPDQIREIDTMESEFFFVEPLDITAIKKNSPLNVYFAGAAGIEPPENEGYFDDDRSEGRYVDPENFLQTAGFDDEENLFKRPVSQSGNSLIFNHIIENSTILDEDSDIMVSYPELHYYTMAWQPAIDKKLIRRLKFTATYYVLFNGTSQMRKMEIFPCYRGVRNAHYIIIDEIFEKIEGNDWKSGEIILQVPYLLEKKSRNLSDLFFDQFGYGFLLNTKKQKIPKSDIRIKMAIEQQERLGIKLDPDQQTTISVEFQDLTFAQFLTNARKIYKKEIPYDLYFKKDLGTLNEEWNKSKYNPKTIQGVSLETLPQSLRAYTGERIRKTYELFKNINETGINLNSCMTAEGDRVDRTDFYGTFKDRLFLLVRWNEKDLPVERRLLWKLPNNKWFYDRDYYGQTNKDSVIGYRAIENLVVGPEASITIPAFGSDIEKISVSNRIVKKKNIEAGLEDVSFSISYDEIQQLIKKQQQIPYLDTLDAVIMMTFSDPRKRQQTTGGFGVIAAFQTFMNFRKRINERTIIETVENVLGPNSTTVIQGDMMASTTRYFLINTAFTTLSLYDDSDPVFNGMSKDEIIEHLSKFGANGIQNIWTIDGRDLRDAIRINPTTSIIYDRTQISIPHLFKKLI